MTKNQSLILNPGLHSKLIIKQKNALIFCCQAEQDYAIELWSNLTVEKKWNAFPFTKLHDYHVVVNTQYLEPGFYEYTLRFRIGEEPWSWYGNPNENGHIHIIPLMPMVTPVIPQLYSMGEKLTESVNLWHFKAPLNQKGPFSLGKINQDAYVVCIKKGSCWLTPIGGQTELKHDTNQQWQLLLYKEQGNLHLWLPVGQKADAWLSPASNNSIDLHYNAVKETDVHLLIASTTTDDFSYLVETALNYYKGAISNNPNEIDYKNIAMLQNLGYCTWNAFGKSIDNDKLFEALNSLQSNNIPIKYVIIDDGWQETVNEKLTSMDTCKKKFPDGLKETVSQIKSKYPFIQSVGVWHTLWGYWNGIDKDFAKDYGYYSAMDTKNNEIGLICDPKKFYRDFYSFLKNAGIDFVKVDNQGSFQDLIIKNKLFVWDSYRQAMIESAEKLFQGNVIHSMALTPHNLLNPILSPNHKSIFRNSDDFFPNEDKSHVWHIYANAINTLWKTPALVSDWDMFQSYHPFAEYHATSRAMSGGPIYITDIPSKHNTELMYKLVGQTKLHGYTILKSKQSPLPTLATVFGNPIENESIIGLCNLHREKKDGLEYGICGFWNTGPHDRLGVVTRNNWIRFNLVNKVIAFVVSGTEKGKLMPLNFGEDDVYNTSKISCVMSVRVKKLESSLVCICPIRSLGTISVACLGLIDKFNATASIQKTSLGQYYEAHLTHRSHCCAFWMNTKPIQVILDGHSLTHGVDWNWNETKGLLKVDMMTTPLDAIVSDTFCIQLYL